MREEKIRCLFQGEEVEADLGRITFPKNGRGFNFKKPQIAIAAYTLDIDTSVPEKDLTFLSRTTRHRVDLAIRRFRDFLSGKTQNIRRH